MGTRKVLGILAVVLTLATAGQAQRAGQPAGRWIGQDGHDRVGPSSSPGPSDVQDIRITLTGLPPGRTITAARVKALGGAEWAYGGPPGPWLVDVVQKPGSTTADLFLEPAQAETGRPFRVSLRLDNGRTLEIDVRGGAADPNRRMAAASVKARWIGQDGADRTGLGPGVGPDGLQDIHLALSGLSPKAQVRAVAVEVAGQPGWAYGSNPERRHNAELIRSSEDPSRASLYFQPDRDLAGQTLTLTIQYANDRTDRATLKAARVDPGLRTKAPAPFRFDTLSLAVRWLGQDGQGPDRPGDVHLAIDGLPAGRAVAAVALSNSARTCWYQKGNDRVPFEPEPYALPLHFRRGERTTRAELFFPPVRDETGGTMTLRLVFADGRTAVATFPGGKADPGARAGAGPSASRVVAKPGDDLMALAERHGHIKLTRGTYRLDHPLILLRPVAITAEPGAVLLFSQRPNAQPWTAAIKIRAGHTTLDGFAVRFTGPIRWRQDVNHGPAVIGVTDNHDPPRPGVIADLNLTRLDLQSPPPVAPGRWEDATPLARLVGAICGRIEQNTLRGGPIAFSGGPWRVVGNEARGTPPGTTSPAVFTAHDTQDLVVADNVAQPDPGSGKTWRFLVLTGSGYRDRVENNRVEGLGPRDGEDIPNANAPETILTESYRIHFEGRPAAVGAGGRVLQIPAPQGEPTRTGAVVAILAGEDAGTWRRVAQAIDPNTYLVDPPLPPSGVEAVSIVTGFVLETFAGNTVDARGSTAAVPLVLAGNHFGTKVIGNRFLGGGEAFRIGACASELPIHWGWSRAPFLDGLIERNAVEDSARGGWLGVECSPATKSTRGRVYVTATLRDNRASWGPTAPAGQRVGFRVGEGDGNDPAALRLVEAGTRAEGGTPLLIHAATVNGRVEAGAAPRVAMP